MKITGLVRSGRWTARLTLAGAVLGTTAGIIVVAMASSPAQARGRVIYGDDDRRDLYANDVDPRMRELARATALLVRRSEISSDAATGFTKIDTTSFADSVGNMCQDEPFRQQPVAGYCSGFLVGPDTFVTAGHCTRAVSCDSMAVIFGYGLETQEKDLTKVPNADVYTCRQVIAQVLEGGVGDDYAVIKLDRPVAGREPLAFRRSGAVAVGDELTVIGHPMTLPTKIAGGRSAVRDISAGPYFVASLDTYGGNSGSAVFNSRTYEVEGILVRGEQDMEQVGGCMRSKVCAQASCRGEDVTRIANVLPYLPGSEDTRPTQAATAEQAGLDRAIPDNSQTGVTVELPITAPGQVAKINVKIKVQHTDASDLEAMLVHPDGTQIALPRTQEHTAGSFELAWGSEGTTTPALSSLREKEAQGSWKLILKDRVAGDSGRLKAATLKIDIYQD